jgi:uncharacterized protein YndB with AHSA1/START domain
MTRLAHSGMLGAMTAMTGDVVSCTCEVPVPVERAFEVFVDELATWWPAEYTWSADVLDTIAIEPRAGGMCFERGPHGFRCDWGRVLTFERPDRIVFSWQVGPGREPVPDPEQASEVEVRFVAGGEGTRVELEHRGFTRHGEGADEYRAGLGSPQGWPYITDRYVQAAGRVSDAAGS